MPDLLHIGIKKPGRIQPPGHRVTGNRRDTVEGTGWDFVFVAIDDHARVAFTDIHPDERFPSAVQFFKDAVACYQRQGVTILRLLAERFIQSALREWACAHPYRNSQPMPCHPGYTTTTGIVPT